VTKYTVFSEYQRQVNREHTKCQTLTEKTGLFQIIYQPLSPEKENAIPARARTQTFTALLVAL
jgi:hypothetical protein